MSRYRNDEDDHFETRRGRARSYAEEKFFEAQRNRDYSQPTDDPRQFDWGSGDREQQERDRRISESAGTASDRPSRDRNDRGDYYRPPAGDSGMRYDRRYEGHPGAEDAYYAERAGASGTIRRERIEDDYGRRRDSYRDDSYRDERDYTRPSGYGYEERGGERQRGASRSHVRCRDIMTRDVTVATRETTLDHIAEMMRDEDTGVIPVVESTDDAMTQNNLTTAANLSADKTTDAASAPTAAQTMSGQPTNARRGERAYGKLVGLITDRDIVIRAIAEGREARATRAEEIMTADVHTAEPNDRVIDAIRKMGDKQVRRIPVCDRDGNLRGIISMADVALETEEDRELAHALEEISSGKSFWSRMFG